jgi:hypothetical protein
VAVGFSAQFCMQVQKPGEVVCPWQPAWHASKNAVQFGKFEAHELLLMQALHAAFAPLKSAK